MPMVKSNVHVGDDLRKAFQWDVDVPFDVLVQQLLKVLDSQEPQYPKVQKIVEHLGHRTLKMSDLSSLRAHLQGLKWIPTRQKTLISINFALLGGEDIPAVGFYSVAFDSNIRKFFYDMGCVDRYRVSFFESIIRKKLIDIQAIEGDDPETPAINL